MKTHHFQLCERLNLIARLRHGWLQVCSCFPHLGADPPSSVCPKFPISKRRYALISFWRHVADVSRYEASVGRYFVKVKGHPSVEAIRSLLPPSADVSLFSPALRGVFVVTNLRTSFTKRSVESWLFHDSIEWMDVIRTPEYKKRATGGTSSAGDPHVFDQWHLAAVNINGARQAGLTGSGVQLRINDDGIFISASDLVVNLSASFNFVSDVEDPTPPAIPDCFSSAEAFCAHGTFCASIAAGLLGNGYCGAGVAPGVSLSGAAVIGYGSRISVEDIANALLANVDVVSNSWGLSGCESRKNPFVESERRVQYCILAPIPKSSS